MATIFGILVFSQMPRREKASETIFQIVVTVGWGFVFDMFVIHWLSK